MYPQPSPGVHVKKALSCAKVAREAGAMEAEAGRKGLYTFARSDEPFGFLNKVESAQEPIE